MMQAEGTLKGSAYTLGDNKIKYRFQRSYKGPHFPSLQRQRILWKNLVPSDIDFFIELLILLLSVALAPLTFCNLYNMSTLHSTLAIRRVM